MDEDKQNLYKFVKKAIALRRSNPVLARKNFFRGDLVAGTEMKEKVNSELSGKYGSISSLFLLNLRP